MKRVTNKNEFVFLCVFFASFSIFNFFSSIIVYVYRFALKLTNGYSTELYGDIDKRQSVALYIYLFFLFNKLNALAQCNIAKMTTPMLEEHIRWKKNLNSMYT